MDGRKKAQGSQKSEDPGKSFLRVLRLFAAKAGRV
jgi:hypothetical protein